ncbi:hypothetical protein IKO70_02520 [bacterium]|nr:hypothetical protein [bacterium]
MKKAFSLFSILLIASLFLASCGGSERKPVKHEDPSDTEVVNDTDPTDEPTNPTDTASNCGNHELEEGEVCDGNAMECNIIDPGYTGGYATCNPDCSGWDMSGCQGNQTDPTNPDDPTDPTDDPTDPDDTEICDQNNEGEIEDVFIMGPYTVNTIDIKSGTDGAPRDFRIYEPTGAEGNIPIVHFLHGFQLKYEYYDDFLTHLASHGFIVVSSQSNHGLLGAGGDSSTEEATKVITLIDWLKQNLQSKISVIPDFKNVGVSGHSRGGKVTNRVLNTDPKIAKSFFGVDPVDSAAGKDSQSLNDPVQFKGKSMFLGTEKGPSGIAACAPSGDNSIKFYASYPSPSRLIIAAGVGHNDMLDTNECGLTCSVCASGSNDAAKQFITYTGGLMTAFFKSTLKCETQYEALLNDSSTHPFATTFTEHK